MVQDIPFDYRVTYPSVDSKIIINQSVSRSTDFHESIGVSVSRSMGISQSTSYDLTSPQDLSAPPQPLSLSQRLQLIEGKQRRRKSTTSILIFLKWLFAYFQYYHY